MLPGVVKIIPLPFFVPCSGPQLVPQAVVYDFSSDWFLPCAVHVCAAFLSVRPELQVSEIK